MCCVRTSIAMTASTVSSESSRIIEHRVRHHLAFINLARASCARARARRTPSRLVKSRARSRAADVPSRDS